MERVINADMLSFLQAHNVITKQQLGFLSRRSTSSNLLETLNDWTLAIRDKQSVLVEYRLCQSLRQRQPRYISY